MITKQAQEWAGKFGEDYTRRNALTDPEFDESYRKKYSLTRREMNDEFIGHLNRSATILEVGCNRGDQMHQLEGMGFKRLFGIDVQYHALREARAEGRNVTLATVFNLPYRTDAFDMVCTSGLLVHISPDIIESALREIYRCSKKYIWGFEYYSEWHEEIPYRNRHDMLWKGNFAKMFTDRFSDLTIMKKRIFKYACNNNMDSMFLLTKQI